MPITAFILGTWQVKRLKWKTEILSKFEDRILRPPLRLPPTIDPAAIQDFDHRRIYAEGTFRHDQEMLLGPRIHDGKNGYFVITPLERTQEGGSKVLVNRGWISKEQADQASRERGLPTGTVTVQGMLREPFKKNLFTPDNQPEKGEFYFPDVVQMASLTGSQPVWVEETMEQNYLESLDRIAIGYPVGRPAEVNIRNNHTQYIFTWYSLSFATAIMFIMVMRKPTPSAFRRVQHPLS